jgi:replicative DNA helicase
MTETLPPHNLEAEKLLIGGLLCDQREMDLCMEILQPSDLYDGNHQTLWHEMVTSHVLDKPMALVHAEDALAWDLKVNAPVGTGLTRYAKVVKEEANKRRVYEMGHKAVKQANNGQTAQELIDTLSGELADIESQGASEAISMSSAMVGALGHVESVQKGNGGRVGRSTGFERLDHMLGGLAPGALYLIAARPSIGKTSLGLSMALASSQVEEGNVLIVSMEMSREELSLRFLSLQSHISLAKIRTGRTPTEALSYEYLTKGDFTALSAAAGELSDLPILIDDTANVTPSSLRNHVKRLNTKGDLGLVVVDYVQLMNGDRKGMDDYQRVSEASRHLKLIALEFHVPVIAMSQLNRECEKRGDKRPQLSDLRETGSLEQDADAVMFIYRPGYYDLPGFDKDYTDIIISKHRNGPCGTVPIIWQPELARFS